MAKVFECVRCGHMYVGDERFNRECPNCGNIGNETSDAKYYQCVHCGSLYVGNDGFHRECPVCGMIGSEITKKSFFEQARCSTEEEKASSERCCSDAA